MFKFKFTAIAVRSSTYVLFRPFRIFWEPIPSFTNRRHFVRFASLLSLRIASCSLWLTFSRVFNLKGVRPHDMFKFKFTAIPVRSSTYVLFTPLRIFWEPATSFTNRRHFVRFVSLLSRRVASRSLWRKFSRIFNLNVWGRTICSNLNLPP